MAPPISDFERRLRELEGEIKRLELEYNQFFTGRLPKLPWETRARVEAIVKQYDRMHIQNTAERFRFHGLQARYSAFCERWERDLKAREFGRPGARGRSMSEPPSSSAPSTPPPTPGTPSRVADDAPPARPEVVALRDPESQGERVNMLYRQLNEARRQVGEDEVPFDRFREVVRAQVSKHARDGTEVAFRVGVQDGRVVFTAKAKKDAGEE